MKNKISDLPKATPKESAYSLDNVIDRMIYASSYTSDIRSADEEIILCLANEIKELKEKVQKLERNISTISTRHRKLK